MMSHIYTMTRVLLVWAIASTLSGSTNTDFVPDELFEDAQLTGVQFVDANTGWAVGDRGVIWHTSDGGQHWERQVSPVTCRFESLCFLTPKDGWLVGGALRRYSHQSEGVVLRTRDGGRQWTRIDGKMLPRLVSVRMLDARRGWVVGYHSTRYPVGVFRTSDGGRSWATIPGHEQWNWLAGDFAAPDQGVVAGTHGRINLVRPNGIQVTRTPPLGLVNLRRLKFVDHARAWLVGDGGLVMQSRDSGLSWQLPDSLPLGLTAQFNFHAVSTFEDHCWIAGSPGSNILATADDGLTWQAHHTGHRLTIRDLTFVDQRHGWAVGDMGAILATRDGGQTWQRQRSGGTRAALVGFFAEPSDIPLEFFAKLSGDEGYLGVVELLNRRDVGDLRPSSSRFNERAHDAMLLVGASGSSAAWRFPLRQRGLRLPAKKVLNTWDNANDGRGADRLEEHVVNRIRQWRPEVIVTHAASPSGDSPVAHLVNQIVLAAVTKASDPTSYMDQVTLAGLAPWKVKKVFSKLDNEQPGTISITTAQLSKRSGCALAEQASAARGLIEERYLPGPNMIGFRLATSTVPDDLARRDFFSGIALPPGGNARRGVVSPAAIDVAAVRREAQKRRNIHQILEQSDRAQAQGGGLFGQVADLTNGLDQQSAGEIMFHLAERYAKTGRQDMAADLFRSLIAKHPHHQLVHVAQRWLVQYYSSGETAVRLRRRQSENVLNAAGSRGDVALATAKQVEQSNPDLHSEPAFRFPIAVTYRQQGMPREAERYFQHLISRRSGSAWGQCAQAELWLTHARGTPPKRVANCPTVTAKPRLDGQLNEPLWKKVKPIELKYRRQDDRGWPAFVFLTHDEEFLYIGMRCTMAPQANYEAQSGPRPRDADLEAQDRIDILIDIDRDYTSYYQLTVDFRGWTSEVCFGDPNWNPEWYVAVVRDESAWHVETAIPMAELVSEPLHGGTVWALGVQRTVPGVGFQSWTEPAAVEIIPEGFGLLLLQ